MPTPVRLTFRRVAEADIPLLPELAGRIWRACYPGMIPEAQIEYMLGWMYAPDRIQEEMNRGVTWELAERDNNTVGYLAWETDPSRGVLHLHKLYLAPEHHGLGWGQQMLHHAFEQARQSGARTVELGVNKRNERALKAYRRAGFEIVDSVCREIGQGWVMDDFILRAAVLG